MVNGAHLDIFSGIGGFAIAAQWAGFETVAFCESDQRCRGFLERTWGLRVEHDVRKLDGRRYAGISLLTGGPPCQPASRAGKQGGEGDDRWLWPEALRVLDEAKPDCVVFENPPGILDVGIDGILSEMERIGYEVQCFDIPACAVDSPQLRHRIWIVGFLNVAYTGHNAGRSEHREQLQEDHPRNGQSNEVGNLADPARDSERRIRETARTDRERVGQPSEPNSGDMSDSAEPGRERRDAERAPDGCRPQRPQSLVADAECERRERRGSIARQTESGQSLSSATRLHWQNSIWVPCADGKLRRAPDDSFGLVDGLHRSLLGALGNSICPEVAYQILSAIRPLIA